MKRQGNPLANREKDLFSLSIEEGKQGKEDNERRTFKMLITICQPSLPYFWWKYLS
jgi:hypothetical protein